MPALLGRQELRSLAKARLKDSELLYQHGRYDGVFYLCGYVLELALKARICRTLRWKQYQTGSEYQSFKTHSLETLLALSGVEHKVRPQHLADWSVEASWNPECRYRPVGSATAADAKEMLEAARRLLRVL